LGREIRRAFIPGEGFECLLSADYSQIELRIAAHFSGDPALVNAFKAGEDIHTETAAKVFGVLPGTVTREQRDFAKRINFGILYGMGPALFSRETGVSFGEAKRFIENYLATFCGIKEFIERTIIKKAMLDIHADIEREGLRSRMLLQVHDELVFEIAPGEVEEVRDIAVSRMENAVELDVPVVVDTGTGANWLEAH